MKNFVRAGLTAIALTFIWGGFSVIETKAQVTEILKRMDTHYKALKSVQADISRETFNSQLEDTDAYSGNISLLPGKGRDFSLLLEWTKPRNELISVVNGQYVVFVKGSGQALTGDSGSKKLNGKGGGVLKMIGSMDRAEIKANYDVQYLGQEGITGAVQTWHLKLTPKAKSDFKFADLWVDSTGMPLQVKVTALNNDTDTIVLTKVKKNELQDYSIFKIKLPQGTKLVR